jgi:hypothetical protein
MTAATPARKYVCVYVPKSIGFRGQCVWCPYNNTMLNNEAEIDPLSYVQVLPGDKQPARKDVSVLTIEAAAKHSENEQKQVEVPEDQSNVNSDMNNAEYSESLVPQAERAAVLALHNIQETEGDQFIVTRVTVTNNNNNREQHQHQPASQKQLGRLAWSSIDEAPRAPDPPRPVGPFYTSHCQCPIPACSYLGPYQGCLDWCKSRDGAQGFLSFIPKGTYTVTYGLNKCSCCGDIDPCVAPR